jgi:NRAMP (natural resistance-associated macrophage protein)-like metal ion transporter
MEEKSEKEKSILRKLGPGLITGAADDDPSGIATYSQAGAEFGLNMLWTVFFTYPLMVGIQIISARIGRVTGQGLSANIRRYYPRWILYFIVGLLLFANTINIAADVSAMGSAFSLLIGGPSQIYALIFGMISLVLQLFIPYSRYVRFLKWLTLALLAYVATVFVVKVPWNEVLWSTLLPRISWRRAYLTTLVGVFGTTISPYLFFWQASQEVEDQNLDPKAHALKNAPSQVEANFNRIKIDINAF